MVNDPSPEIGGIPLINPGLRVVLRAGDGDVARRSRSSAESRSRAEADAAEGEPGEGAGTLIVG